MYRLIKIELNYFMTPLLTIIVLLLAFTLFALGDIKLLSDVVFLRKYSWSMIIGLGSYGLVFILWAQRVKEIHERMIYLLPVSINSKRWGRWIFAILPFSLVVIYIQLFHFFLPDEWNLHIGRISAQIGFLSMALACIFIIRDYRFIEQAACDIRKLLVAAFIILIATL
jgi:hypothetical protein